MSERSAETADRVTSTQILNAIRRKHAGSAMLTEVGIPPEGGAWTYRRIDMLMWRGLQRTAIEVKVTRADFKRDTAEKRDPWLKVCHRFVYAAPAGLLGAHEIPAGCGLWEVHPDGRVVVNVRTVVRRDPDPLPDRVVQALAYRAMRQEADCG